MKLRYLAIIILTVLAATSVIAASIQPVEAIQNQPQTMVIDEHGNSKAIIIPAAASGLAAQSEQMTIEVSKTLLRVKRSAPTSQTRLNMQVRS